MPSSEYRLPDLPLGSAEARILRWLKHPGESLVAGEPLLIVVSERAEVALPAPAGGVLSEQLCPEGDTVAVGAALATLAPAAPADSLAPVDIDRTPAARSAAPASRCTPVARQIAAAHDLDVRAIPGHGVSGRVTKADVMAVLAGQPAAVGASLTDTATERGGGMVIGAPPDAQVLTAIEVDLGAVVAECGRLRAIFARRELELTATTFVLEAVVAALLRYPLLNGHWDAEYVVVRRLIALELCASGKRVRLPRVQDLNLRGLARALGSAAECAPGDGTFTIVENDNAAWCGMPALAPGQTAALGVGAARARPVVVSEGGAERVGMRPMVLLALAYDARAIDQCYADAFLRDLKARLEGLKK